MEIENGVDVLWGMSALILVPFYICKISDEFCAKCHLVSFQIV